MQNGIMQLRIHRLLWLLCAATTILASGHHHHYTHHPHHPSRDISGPLENVKSMFNTSGIIDALDIDFRPKALLDVIWPAPDGTSHPIRFYPGGHLTDNNTIPLPEFKSIGLKDDNTGPFVIIAVDPDAPSPKDPFLKSICHFIGQDFYLDSNDLLLKNRTKAVSDWIRPNPSPSSCEHRYVFLLYEQPDGFNHTRHLRWHHWHHTIRHFKLATYSRHYDLGNPIAGTFAYIKSNASCWMDGCS